MGKKSPTVSLFQNSTDTAFRIQERLWKSKILPPNLSLAFDPRAIIWSTEVSVNGRITGSCAGIECFKIDLEELGEIGGERWKGKERAREEELFAIGFVGMEGLVFIPQILSPSLQKSLIKESFHATSPPNLTSLSPHYALPSAGLWPTILSGNAESKFGRIDQDGVGLPGPRSTVNLDPVTKENFQGASERGKEGLGEVVPSKKNVEGIETSAAEIFSQLRWATLGWQYDWYSKTYLLNLPKETLPTLINHCCRDLVRSIPWSTLYADSIEESEDWKSWKKNYECQAGVVNFYHLNDSLTAHVDQSEVDAVRPLVSFSLGCSAIFLVGGSTREVKPIAIVLRSGDGLIMSGKKGRRVFHGLPRVLADTLPDFLKSDFINFDTEESEADRLEWLHCAQFLETGVRINLNVRQVFV